MGFLFAAADFRSPFLELVFANVVEFVQQLSADIPVLLNDGTLELLKDFAPAIVITESKSRLKPKDRTVGVVALMQCLTPIMPICIDATRVKSGQVATEGVFPSAVRKLCG